MTFFFRNKKTWTNINDLFHSGCWSSLIWSYRGFNCGHNSKKITTENFNGKFQFKMQKTRDR